MQANTITLPVDVLNNGTVVNKDYLRHSEEVNKTTYVGPGHTLQSRNTMQLYRTLPKRTGNFLGSGKTSIKFTQDFAVPGADGVNVTAPAIVSIDFSTPVGLTAAQTLELRQRAVAALDHVFAASLNDSQEI